MMCDCLDLLDFFSPANVMKLLEIVRGASSSPEAISACLQLGKKIGKTSVVAGNCFGFIGNRMLGPYAAEAAFLVEEGVNPLRLDSLLKKRVGLAMGPFEVSHCKLLAIIRCVTVQSNRFLASTSSASAYTPLFTLRFCGIIAFPFCRCSIWLGMMLAGV